MDIVWNLKFEKIFKNISIALFVLVLIGAILSERENIIIYFAQAGLVTLILNLLMIYFSVYLILP